MPQATRGRSAAAAAAEAQSSSEETPEAEPRPKQGKTGGKKCDKTACAAALEELESLNHEAASIIKKPVPAKATPPKNAPAVQQNSREPDARSERVKEMERKRKEKEAQDAQTAEIQRLAAENEKLKRKLNVAPRADSKPTKPAKQRKSNTERREKKVNAVFVMCVGFLCFHINDLIFLL